MSRRFLSQIFHRILSLVSRERQRGGGNSGGGAKPHEETPHGKQFPTPLTSVRFPPSQCHFSYEAPYKLPEIPSGDPLKNSFRRVSKNGFPRGHPCEVLPRPAVLPPPLARPSVFSAQKKCQENSSRKIPRKILQNLCNNKSPTCFCRGAGPTFVLHEFGVFEVLAQLGRTRLMLNEGREVSNHRLHPACS